MYVHVYRRRTAPVTIGSRLAVGSVQRFRLIRPRSPGRYYTVGEHHRAGKSGRLPRKPPTEARERVPIINRSIRAEKSEGVCITMTGRAKQLSASVSSNCTDFHRVKKNCSRTTKNVTPVVSTLCRLTVLFLT